MHIDIGTTSLNKRLARGGNVAFSIAAVQLKCALDFKENAGIAQVLMAAANKALGGAKTFLADKRIAAEWFSGPASKMSLDEFAAL